MGWIKDLWDILKPKTTDPIEVTKVYVEAIKFLKDELKEQREIIEKYRKRHPENGEELDEWDKREIELNRRIMELLQQNRDLREENIFLKKGTKE